MFCKTIKYLLKTPLNDIRNDFKQYQEVISLYFKSKNVCKMYRRRLINDLGGCAEDLCDFFQGCFVKCVKLNVDPREGDIMPRFCFKLCEHFDENVLCKEKTCSFYLRNVSYFRALEESKQIKKVRDNFWKNKFALIK